MIIWVQILLFDKNTKYWPLIKAASNDSYNINRPDQFADISMFKVPENSRYILLVILSHTLNLDCLILDQQAD